MAEKYLGNIKGDKGDKGDKGESASVKGFVEFTLYDQTFNSGVAYDIDSFNVLHSTQPINNGKIVLSAGYWLVTYNLTLNIGDTAKRVYHYLRLNSDNVMSNSKLISGSASFPIFTVLKVNEGDEIGTRIYYTTTSNETVSFSPSTLTNLTLKKIGNLEV